MAVNTITNVSWVTKEVSRYWLNALNFAAHVNRDYDDQWLTQGGAKIGFTVQARLPQRFQPMDGQALQLQSILNQTTPISLTDQIQIAFGWSSADATVSIEEVRERYAMPAAEALANATDSRGLSRVWSQVNNDIGVPGTASTAGLTYLQAVAKLRLLGVPEPYVAVLDETSTVTLSNAYASTFNPQGSISDNYMTGEFGNRGALGVRNWYHDPNVAHRTTGSFTTCTPLVDGGDQTGSTLLSKAWASGATTLKKGDVITVSGVDSVNSLSYVSTGQKLQFTVTADISDTSQAILIPIYPPIIPSGQLQNVTASPADNAAIQVVGSTITTGSGALTATSSSQSLIYNKSAFALVMADLKQPRAGALSTTVRSKELGISIRMVEQYNIQTDQEPSRFDILLGWATVRPEFAIRSEGA